MKTRKNDWGKYIIVFFITLALFAVAAGLSNFFSNKKIDDIRSVQNKLSTDILSSETQFLLLSGLSCKQDSGEVNLSAELNNLTQKIDYAEKNLEDNSQVIELKKEYSLLEIRDYLLMKKIDEKCGEKFTPLLYFYTTANNCTECVKQGYVLTNLRKENKHLRIYSFDYSLNLSALKALITIYNIDDTKLPAVVINDKTYTGFQSIDEIKKIAPEIVKDDASTPTPTHTKKQLPKNDNHK